MYRGLFFKDQQTYFSPIQKSYFCNPPCLKLDMGKIHGDGKRQKQQVREDTWHCTHKRGSIGNTGLCDAQFFESLVAFPPDSHLPCFYREIMTRTF